MNFKIDQWSAAALRCGLVAFAVVGIVLLASCGGSVSSQEFAPTRMLVFGDETSVLTGGSTEPSSKDAKKYTINGLLVSGSTTELDCRLNPLWVQWLATNYNFVFKECNPTNAVAKAFNYAEAGATVADVEGQVNAWLNSGKSFGPTDLVTVMVGQNDIINIYETYVAAGVTSQAAQDQAVNDAYSAGLRLAALFNNVITNKSNSKARAVYVVIPDVGQTPYGLAQDAAGRNLLSRMTFGVDDSIEGFNRGLSINIRNNGRSLGKINGYDLFNDLIRNEDFANNYGIVDVTSAGCLLANQPAYVPPTPTPPTAEAYCSSATLVVPNGGSPYPQAVYDSYYLWADQTHFGKQGHYLLGNFAINLAENNPW